MRLPKGIDRKLWSAAQDASARLTAAGIDHRLIGGLAVAVHGYVRATRDIDFLLSDEAFVEHEGGVVTLHPEVPLRIHGATVDAIPLHGSEIDAGIFDENAVVVDGVPVATAAAVVYLKLRASRRRDLHDVRELIAAGLDVEAVAKWLDAQDPALAERLIELTDEVDAAGEK
jgi:hypothetical protein